MILCSRCMLLAYRNHLATRGKMYGSSKANQEAMFRHRRFKPHLPSHRHLPDTLQLIVLPRRVQQARSHNLLPLARIPHGGFLWCLLCAVRLLQRVNNGDAAHGQSFSLHVCYLIDFCRDTVNMANLGLAHFRGSYVVACRDKGSTCPGCCLSLHILKFNGLCGFLTKCLEYLPGETS